MSMRMYAGKYLASIISLLFITMPDSKPQKIVYLLGAGATHAELANLEKDSQSEKFEKQKGLLISNVSDRVIEKAQLNRKYLRDIRMVSAMKGSLNIELLISLIENSRIRDSEYKTSYLKRLVREDIEAVLTKSKVKKFYLHKALLELHEHEKTKEKESLLGFLSLNYDNVLDEAYKIVHKKNPDYSFLPRENDQIPLLKLHGSFNWEKIKIRGRTRTIQIIPIGANKNYLHLPYNFIWNRALELLIQCDILRVIGCALSPNDTHLIDLLFKAHLERGTAFEIQIISSDKTGDKIQENYGFFPEIKRLSEIEPPLIPDTSSVSNTFKTWLNYKSRKLIQESELARTKYLKKVIA